MAENAELELSRAQMVFFTEYLPIIVLTSPMATADVRAIGASAGPWKPSAHVEERESMAVTIRQISRINLVTAAI